MPPIEQTDSVNKPQDSTKEGQDSSGLACSIWDEIKDASSKLSAVLESKLPAPDFLDFGDNSLYCSNLDHKSKDNGPAKQLDAQLHEVKKGETLTAIAKEHLGQGASKEEISKHIKEIAELNGIKNPDLIMPGKKLILPGHTQDGGKISIDEQGTRTTKWPDGKVREEKKDGTGYMHVPGNEAGAYTDTHFGPAKEDNFVVKVSGDGMMIVDDLSGNKVTSWPNGNELVENKDGSGRFKIQGADGKFTTQHWGKTPEENYTLVPQADGSYQGTDQAGNKHSRWDDGSEKIEYKDGRGFVSKPDCAGGRSEHHWGPRPQDNFELSRRADGKVEVKEKPADPAHQPVDDPEVNSQRQKVQELAEQKIKDPGELAKFQADMARFETRMHNFEEEYKKQGMSQAEAEARARKELAETYKQIGKLIEAQDNPAIKLDERQRLQIAQQVMSNAANPTSINQGIHPTCNVATVECRTYTQSPSQAAKLVAEVTTTGKYTAKDGSKVEIDAGSLEAHDQAKTHPPIDGQRGHASQIFQVTAVNVHYQKDGGKTRYQQREGEGPGDNGERLIDYSSNPPEVKKPGFIGKFFRDEKDSDYHAPLLSDESIVGLANDISGDNKQDWYIRHGSPDDGSIVKVESRQALEEKIKEAKDNGKLPIVIKVHSGNEPFYTDSGAGQAGGSGGWHVVTITDYDENTKKVSIDNQWGSRVDHHGGKSMISTHDLYMTMRDPKDSAQISILEADVKDAQARGDRDYYKEAELLRLKFKKGDLNNEEYRKELAEVIKDACRKWGEPGGRANREEYVRNWSKLDSAMNNLPADEKLKLIDKARAEGFYQTDANYENKLTNMVITVEWQKKQDEKEGKFDDKKKAEYEKARAQYDKMLNDLPQAKRDAIKLTVENALKD